LRLLRLRRPVLIALLLGLAVDDRLALLMHLLMLVLLHLLLIINTIIIIISMVIVIMILIVIIVIILIVTSEYVWSGVRVGWDSGCGVAGILVQLREDSEGQEFWGGAHTPTPHVIPRSNRVFRCQVF
jgi:hypothetical protein